MMNFLEKFRPCKVVEIEEPSVWKKIGKGVLIGVGVVAGIATVFTVVEVVLVKFFKRNTLAVVIKFQECHFVFTVRTFERVIAKRRKDSRPPPVETAVNRMFASGNGTAKF